MPKNPWSRAAGPLDSLPRPLSERRGRGGRQRHILALMTTALVVGIVVVGAGTIAGRSGPAPTQGEVAGIVATPEATRPSATISSPAPTDAPATPMTETRTAPPLAAPLAATPATPATLAVPAYIPDDPTPVSQSAHGPDPATLTGYRWPLAHARLTLPFGPTPWGGMIVDGKNFHDGIDLATFCDDRIVAAHDGVVVAAGRHFDDELGWIGSLAPYYARLDKKHLWNTLPIVVVVDDGNGYRSIYAHFWKAVVKRGDVVKAGDLLGKEGRTGRASGCHLHYGLFSPDETATFDTDKDVAKRMKLPRAEIARIDPLLVLPPRRKDPKPWSSAAP